MAKTAEQYRAMSLIYASGRVPEMAVRPRKHRRKYRKQPPSLLLMPLNERLAFLKRHASKGKSAPKSQIAAVRRQFEELKYQFKLDQLCHCCEARRAVHRHHIQPIYLSGQNDPKNIAIICEECHRQLHPWMNDRRGMAEVCLGE